MMHVMAHLAEVHPIRRYERCADRHRLLRCVRRLATSLAYSRRRGSDRPVGWASFNGKATYAKWDAAAGTYVTVGNQSFAV